MTGERVDLDALALDAERGIVSEQRLLAVVAELREHREREVTASAPRSPAIWCIPEPRLRACVEAWPECHDDGYDPKCCRFPKSCSCRVYDLDQVGPEDLEEVEP